ncbi:hypothetical protein DAEQUDRAFT_379474 [Daedalea quercina L-15889]|uniref:Uncharacterized protein n=1 Tax=Daedalea quercina L-15889 TaxID=1314783 RepID=A0A165P4K9_9APHY|nr:hypothetical protein DAEQUDRAFT_379474 [Daedalea quercina L-15889]
MDASSDPDTGSREVGHYEAYDEEREAARPFLPLSTPSEAALRLSPSALLEIVDTKLNELADQQYHASRRMCALKRLRNNAARINRIPPEVLAEAFLFGAAGWFGVGGWTTHETPLVISHVCAYWRALALDTPRLWTSIPLIRRELAELFLVRSKDRRVACWTDRLPVPSTPSRARELQRLLPVQRLQGLHVSLEDEGDMVQFLQALRSPAPYIQDLNLVTGHDSMQTNRWTLGFEKPATTPLFASSTPNLQTLTLKNFDLDLTSGTFKNLVKLELLEQWFVQPVGVFLDALERCPCLEHLAYQRTREAVFIDGEPYPEHLPAHLRHVKLWKLRTLALECQPSAWLAFVLGSLDISQYACVRLSAFNEGDEADLSLNMLPGDLSRIVALSSIRSLHIDYEDRFKLFTRPDYSRYWQTPMGSLTLLQSFRSPVSLAYRDTFIKLNVRDLEELIIEGPRSSYSWVSPDWPLCFRQTINLGHLHLIDVDPTVAAKILSALFMSSPACGGGITTGTQLSKLELTRLHYSGNLERELANCMRRSAVTGGPLKTVKLVNMHWPFNQLPAWLWNIGPEIIERER